MKIRISFERFDCPLQGRVGLDYILIVKCDDCCWQAVVSKECLIHSATDTEKLFFEFVKKGILACMEKQNLSIKKLVEVA